MRRSKPSIKIPYKRYERAFGQEDKTSESEDGAGIVLKDITANPPSVTTVLRPEKPEEDTSEGEKSGESQAKWRETQAGSRIINNNIKIRRRGG